MFITTLMAIGLILPQIAQMPVYPIMLLTPRVSDSVAFEGHIRVIDEVIENPYCSCVKTLAEKVKIPLQDADMFKPNSPPFVGAVAIFKYPTVSHIALITHIKGDFFTVYEGNYEECKQGTRDVMWNDKSLIGFYSP